jgi:O-antigen ligase
MVLLQCAVVAAVALIILPGFSFYFDVTPKIVILLAGTAVMLLTLGVANAREGATGRWRADPRIRAINRRFSVLLLLGLLSLAVSTAFSSHPAMSLFGSNWRRSGSIPQATVLLFAWMVARTCAGRPERVRTILRAVTLAGMVTAGYGIFQYAGWDPFLPSAAYHVGEGIWTIVRPPGTLGYASYFATWLLFVVFLGLAQYSMEGSHVWRRVAIAAAALATVAMLLTGTRAAVLGFVAGGVVLALWRGSRLTRRQVTAAWVAAALALGAMAALYYSPLGRQLRSRARWFAEDPWGGARVELWRDSLAMSLHSPLAGYGPELFTADFPHFESLALARAYPDFAHESPHNIFLDALVSQGIPGFAILIALCVDGFYRARRLKAAGLAAALTAGIISQQFTAFTMPTALLFFTTLALLAALDAEWNRPPGFPPLYARLLSRRIGVASVAILIAVVLFYVAARLTLADRALALAQRALDREDPGVAAARYQTYQRYRLPGGSADLWYSRASLSVALKSKDPVRRTAAMLQSEAAALAATRTSEDPFDAWYNLAVVSGLNNNGTRAEQCLRAAIGAHPNWFKPHWSLAEVLRVEGRTEEARGEAIVAADLDRGKHQEVTRTLDEIRNQLARPVPAPNRGSSLRQ